MRIKASANLETMHGETFYEAVKLAGACLASHAPLLTKWQPLLNCTLLCLVSKQEEKAWAKRERKRERERGREQGLFYGHMCTNCCMYIYSELYMHSNVCVCVCVDFAFVNCKTKEPRGQRGSSRIVNCFQEKRPSLPPVA